VNQIAPSECSTRSFGLFSPAQHPVVRDVAENQIPTGGEIGRALGPAAFGEQALQPCVAVCTPEPLVERLEPGRDSLDH
jgi:hypothetical protein